jgi:phosphoribosylglycinamide formyltransferase 2
MKILIARLRRIRKRLVIAAQRISETVIAVDSYENAPAMQVAHGFEVINMLDGTELDRIVAKHQPDFIVPEIGSYSDRTFYDYEKQELQ